MNLKVLLFALFVVILQSCSKDSSNNGDPIINYFYLSDFARNQTPYFNNKAFDTISFASDKGDTITFVKTRTDTTWFCEYTPFNTLNQKCYQTLHNTYTTIKGVGLLDVKHIRENEFLNTFLKIKFNDKIFYYDDVVINDISFPTYIGDVVKNGKEFKKAIYTYDRYTDSTNSISNVNKDFGLFFIDDKINNLKYLINK